MENEDSKNSMTPSEKIELLEAEVKQLRGQVNRWDNEDVVKQISVMMAAGLRVAAYRVRNLETKEWGPLQFHMTYNNLVMAIMTEEAAKLFVNFVNDTVSPSLGPK